jgi:hypothetical protein
MGSGSEMRVLGGSSLKHIWTYVPGGAGAGGSSACPPHALGCRGSRVPGEIPAGAALNGERGALRGRRSIPLHTYPEGTLGMVDGWATRTGQGCDALAACSESGVGGGAVSASPSPAAGDRGNWNPVAGAPQAQH